VTDRWRVLANLATLGNGLLGLGAILYTLAGNPLWAMLLIALAIGFDGLDGMLSRRSATPPAAFGRVADSVADGVTFGVAPGVLIAVHTGDVATWHPWLTPALIVAVGYVAAAFARLTYFTARGHQHPWFLGVPSPQSALALIVVLLFHDVPAFQSVAPLGVLVGASIVAVMMVVPVPYPKIRRGATLRPLAAATAALAAVALVPIQFRPAPGTPLYELAEAAAWGFLVAVALYYLDGPFTVHRPPPEAA
jgi:phosphatidylserine synthase